MLPALERGGLECVWMGGRVDWKRCETSFLHFVWLVGGWNVRVYYSIVVCVYTHMYE